MSRGRQLALLGVVVCAYFVLFGRALRYEYVWDDVAEIQSSPLLDLPLLDGIQATQTERNDPTVTELVGVQLAYDSYRPLLFASYWLEVRWWGRSAFAMHATNLVLGALGILGMFGLARRFASAPIALAATAAFALHPVQVEPIAYISGRADLLAGVLALCCALCVLRGIDSRRSIAWTTLAAIAFACSLLTKEACIGLPVAIAALLWAKHQLRARWRIVAVLAGVALAYLVVRRLVVVPTTSSAVLAGIAALPSVVIEYVRIVALPFDLSTERLHHTPAFVGWGAIVVAIAAIMFARRRGYAPPRELVAGLVWFVALLAPSAVAIGASTGVVADRYAFAPLAGLALAAAVGTAAFLRWRPRAKRPLQIVLALWGLMLLGVAWMQVPVWRDNDTLYSHAVAMTPESSEAHYRLAYLAARRNDWDTAIPLLERAVELDGRNVRALVNLGVGRLRTGDPAAAETTLARAVLANPAAFRAWFNLGLARLQLGKRTEGCAAIRRALAINPRYAVATQTQRDRCQ